MELHSDATATSPVTTQTRGKMRLLTLDHIDGRTAAAKRARDLMESIEQDLGGADRLSEGSRQLVQRAAVLGTFIESCEASWLSGETVELADYLAAINSQRRVLQTIGLERRARDVNELTLSEYLSRAHSETVAEVATGEAETRSMGRRKGSKRRADVPEPESFVDHDADGDGSP